MEEAHVFLPKTPSSFFAMLYVECVSLDSPSFGFVYPEMKATKVNFSVAFALSFQNI